MNAPKSKATKSKATIRSQISFPYRDLSAGIAVAQKILDGGGVPHSSDQLAGAMGLQPGTGNFVVRVAAARIFGLITHALGKYELTGLGFAITDKDEKRRKQAMVQAFLAVPLYRRVYDEFRGKQLPPRPLGLEQAFVKFGVSQKQATAARQIFDKSAEQAGFFDKDDDRLIEPILGLVPSPENRPPMPDEFLPAERVGPPVVWPTTPARPPLHPFVQGLLDTLPQPGTEWGVYGRVSWLEAAEKIFELLYEGKDGEITIDAIYDAVAESGDAS